MLKGGGVLQYCEKGGGGDKVFSDDVFLIVIGYYGMMIKGDYYNVMVTMLIST